MICWAKEEEKRGNLPELEADLNDTREGACSPA